MPTSISIELPGAGVIATLHNVVALGEVNLAIRKGTRYAGELTNTGISPAMLEALQEYREIADDGVIGLLDDALLRVLKLEPFARLIPEGTTGRLTDFQLNDGHAAIVVDPHPDAEGSDETRRAP
jgi:hypothetical protein